MNTTVDQTLKHWSRAPSRVIQTRMVGSPDEIARALDQGGGAVPPVADAVVQAFMVGFPTQAVE